MTAILATISFVCLAGILGHIWLDYLNRDIDSNDNFEWTVGEEYEERISGEKLTLFLISPTTLVFRDDCGSLITTSDLKHHGDHMIVGYWDN